MFLQIINMMSIFVKTNIIHSSSFLNSTNRVCSAIIYNYSSLCRYDKLAKAPSFSALANAASKPCTRCEQDIMCAGAHTRLDPAITDVSRVSSPAADDISDDGTSVTPQHSYLLCMSASQTEECKLHLAFVYIFLL